MKNFLFMRVLLTPETYTKENPLYHFFSEIAGVIDKPLSMDSAALIFE